MSVQPPGLSVPTDGSRHRWLATAALLIAIAALTMKFVQFVDIGVREIRYPFEIDYGEGIVWQQALRIASGHAYTSIAQYPAIVFHYPPLFHLISTAAAAIFGLDQLAAGRLVSLVSTGLIGGFAGLIVFRTLREDAGSAAASICAVIGGLGVFTFWPVLVWSPLMRVDMVATAFSFAGVWLGIVALRKPAAIHVAALCFVAAVYTKQTSVVAPAATFVTLWLVRPKVARVGLVTTVLSGTIVLAALTWWTDGGFIRHVFLYNINRFEAWRLKWIAQAVGLHGGYFGVAAVGVWLGLRDRLPAYRGISGLAALRHRLAAAPADAAMLLILVYFVLATAMLITIAKSGSNINYLIEWLCVVAILVGLAMRAAAIAMVGRTVAVQRARSMLLLAAVLPAAVAVQAFRLPSAPDQTKRRAPIADIQKLVTLVREARQPVISDDMVLLLRAGKQVEWEPAIFAELASEGLWDERPFVRLIREHHFAFFVTVGDRGGRLFDSRYSPAVADAIESAYPLKRHLARYTLHLPAAGI